MKYSIKKFSGTIVILLAFNVYFFFPDCEKLESTAYINVHGPVQIPED